MVDTFCIESFVMLSEIPINFKYIDKSFCYVYYEKATCVMLNNHLLTELIQRVACSDNVSKQGLLVVHLDQ